MNFILKSLQTLSGCRLEKGYKLLMRLHASYRGTSRRFIAHWEMVDLQPDARYKLSVSVILGERFDA